MNNIDHKKEIQFFWEVVKDVLRFPDLRRTFDK